VLDRAAIEWLEEEEIPVVLPCPESLPPLKPSDWKSAFDDEKMPASDLSVSCCC